MFAMKHSAYGMGDARKQAVADTVCSILESKGRDVVSIAPTATVFDAIAEMARREVGALLVLDGRTLTGIVSERDYARKVILQGRSSKDTQVQEIMTPSPVTVRSSETVDECLRLVTQKRIRHLPVVDDGVLQGMISIGDLVKTIISAQSYTIDQLHTYIGAGYPAP
jgi:CBS domain-containing protein